MNGHLTPSVDCHKHSYSQARIATREFAPDMKNWARDACVALLVDCDHLDDKTVNEVYARVLNQSPARGLSR